MSSKLAPQLDDKALPLTPANEWADSTSSALDEQKSASSSAAMGSASVASTPGPDFPGAYPKTPGSFMGSSSAPGSSTGIAGGTIVDAAKNYLPGEPGMQGIVDKAKEYVPSSVAGYFPATKAPAPEKIEKEPTPTVKAENKATEKAEDKLTPKAEEPPSSNRIEESKPSSSQLAAVMPTNEVPFLRDERLGNDIGLPQQGPSGSSAPTPNPNVSHPPGLENSNPIPQASTESSTGPAASTNFSTKAAHGHSTTDSSKYGSVPTQQTSLASSTAPGTTGTNASTMAVTGHSTTDMSRPSAGLSPLSGSIPMVSESPGPVTPTGANPNPNGATPTPHENMAVPNGATPSPTSSQTASHARTGSTASSGGGKSPSKSRFLNKLKGEAKVLSGKISKDQEKVEEGKRLMGKVV